MATNPDLNDETLRPEYLSPRLFPDGQIHGVKRKPKGGRSNSPRKDQSSPYKASKTVGAKGSPRLGGGVTPTKGAATVGAGGMGPPMQPTPPAGLRGRESKRTAKIRGGSSGPSASPTKKGAKGITRDERSVAVLAIQYTKDAKGVIRSMVEVNLKIIENRGFKSPDFEVRDMKGFDEGRERERGGAKHWLAYTPVHQIPTDAQTLTPHPICAGRSRWLPTTSRRIRSTCVTPPSSASPKLFAAGSLTSASLLKRGPTHGRSWHIV